eukprot:GHVP01047744.1.p1 GENE.GHVP01047744.1~~GHVP01047744.1.p1  ORF type:complete len:793 (+),score=143.77 GHVP01047744.1:97-2379(+)
MYQLVDQYGDFRENVDFANSNLNLAGFDYNVVAVLGCQSSGKSTLLNNLYGTKFQVMNEFNGRSQTTEGIWMEIVPGVPSMSKPMVILDVEGTDSRERGEDRHTFEHRAALFSLALADMVAINLWFHDIGRYTASNLGLLKTVLAVNYELFQKDARPTPTILAVFIRDYPMKSTPIEKISNMMTDDMKKIWDDIHQDNQSVQKARFHDYFNVMIFGVPSLVDRPDEFNEKCTEIKNSLPLPREYSRRIPADGFYRYCGDIWGNILSQNELNIPSQKTMLSNFRCDELKLASFHEARENITEIFHRLASGKLKDNELGKELPSVFDRALNEYLPSASRYQSDVCKKKKTELIDLISRELTKVMEALLGKRRKVIVDGAVETLKALFCKGRNATIGGLPKQQARKHCNAYITSWKEDTTAKFFDLARECTAIKLADGDIVELDFTSQIEALEAHLKDIIDWKKEGLIKDFEEDVSQYCFERTDKIEDIIKRKILTVDGFWTDIFELLEDIEANLTDEFMSSFEGLHSDRNPEDLEDWKLFARRHSLQQLHRRMTEMSQWIPNHVFERFLLFFDSDEKNVPRSWQEETVDTLNKTFISARDEGKIILEIFQSNPKFPEEKLPEGTNCLQMESTDDTLSKILQPAMKKSEAIEQKCERQMKKAFRDAQTLQATAGAPVKIPWWMWFVLIFFGWNELMYVWRSPIFFIAALFIAVGASLIFYTGNYEVASDFLGLTMRNSVKFAIPLLQSLTGSENSKKKIEKNE